MLSFFLKENNVFEVRGLNINKKIKCLEIEKLIGNNRNKINIISVMNKKLLEEIKVIKNILNNMKTRETLISDLINDLIIINSSQEIKCKTSYRKVKMYNKTRENL